MTKKEYLKPMAEVMEMQQNCELLVESVQATGLGDNPTDKLTQDEENPSGDTWGDAMGRGGIIWDEE